jgi:hypothetical protein
MENEQKENAPKSQYNMTERALASRRANLQKARAAGKHKIYHPTPARQAASRANMARAIAARKSPGGNASARLNALSHGLFSKDVAASVARMGEDPQEFREHHALFHAIFVPVDEEERLWVRRLADINWKRLRFLRAQAAWELERLKKAFEPVTARGTPIGAEETLRRAHIFTRTFAGFVEYIEPLDKFQSRMDRELRKLLKKRSGGKIKYKVFRVTRYVEPDVDVELDKWLDKQLKAPRARVRLR